MAKPKKAAATRTTRKTPPPRPAKPTRTPSSPAPRAARRRAPSTLDVALFSPLSPGERAAALRCLLDDERLHGLAKIGRYRVISVEPHVVKPPSLQAGHRLARVVIYDYASDRCVNACVDLDGGVVTQLSQSTAQPMLSREEELEAIAIATADELVQQRLHRGDEPQAVLHTWSLRVMDFAFRRRSAAVLFGQAGARPQLVVVVNLVDRVVADVQSAERW